MFFVSKLANDDDNNVQMLDNIYDRIANGHSWSIIMIYLGSLYLIPLAVPQLNSLYLY